MLINTFIIGAAKAGTTYVANYLNQHIEVELGIGKELNLFHKNIPKREDIKNKFKKNNRILIDASPVYSECSIFSSTAANIYKYNKNAKLIYLVRDPIDRIQSAFKQALKTGHHNKRNKYGIAMPTDINDAVRLYSPLLTSSAYYFNVSCFLKFFPRNQLHLIFFDKLFNQKYMIDELRALNNFLDLEGNELEISFEKINSTREISEFPPYVPKIYTDLKNKSPLHNVETPDFLKRMTCPSHKMNFDLNHSTMRFIKAVLFSDVKNLYRLCDIPNDPWSIDDWL